MLQSIMPSNELAQSSTVPSDDSKLASPSDCPAGQTLPPRLQHLGIVLWVSLSTPIVGSLYYMLGGASSISPLQQQYRLFGGLVTEVTGLVVLGYVMCQQGRTWRDIGWSVGFADLPRALGLLITAKVVTYVGLLPIQYIYRANSGHFLTPKALHSMFGFGISALSIVFVCLNPFFEELIVRAYTMTEVVNISGSRTLAVIVSVVAQMSYHLYQGLLSGLALTLLFTTFSVYFVRTRRTAPIVLAHLCLDLLGLFRGVF